MKSTLKKILPSSILCLVNYFNLFFRGYSYKSYSQEGEDMILRRIFEGQLGGFFVDVGAHHPKRFSNTYFFYKLGWSGINIDAMPGSMKSFNIIRTRDINIEKPVSLKKEVLTYYGFNEPALNGFSKVKSDERNGLNNFKILFTKEIETCTLEEILDDNLVNFQKIDFLSIDVEGLDFEVLKSLNIDKYRPYVILVELDFDLSDIYQDEIYKFLISKNYRLYAKAVHTFIFRSNT